jgi:ATP-dependent DNA ligase
MEVIHVEEKTSHLKPVMKTLLSVKNIPLPSLLQAKADGEFTFLTYSRVGFSFSLNQAYTLNQWGRLRMNFPALNEFTDAMKKTNIETAELLCELYAKEQNKPLKLPQFIHYAKSKLASDHNKVHIGIFDLLSVNGQPAQDLLWKYEQATSWLKGCSHVSVLPYTQIKTVADAEAFWAQQVKQQGYEGLVIRNQDAIYKIKPRAELDAVIIGVNKKTSYGKGNLFAQNQVTSLHLALMTPEGYFVEIGNVASGIDHQLRSALWKLMDYKIEEDDNVVWIKPLVVCTVEYTDFYKSRNKVYDFLNNCYRFKWNTTLVRMKSPTLKGFRRDKKVTPQDLRKEQIPQEYLAEETT